MPTRRVLIVDDDEVEREHLRRMLISGAPQVEVFEAASAAETLEQLSRTEVDCVLLDDQLGATRGTDFLDSLDETASRHCPVIMLTGQLSERTAIEAVRRGVYDLLPKESLDREQLNAAIEGGVRWAQLRAQLRETEHRFQQLAESLPQLVWTCRADGSSDYMSRQWTDFTGLPPERLTGNELWALVHPDDLAATQSAWQTCMDSAREFRAEFRIRNKEGKYRWFESRSVPILDAQGQVTKWIGLSTDIHENRMLSQALKRHSLMLDLAYDPIFAWTDERGIEYWNRGCEQLYQYTAAEAFGRCAHELLKTEFPVELQQYESELRLSGIWSGELLHTRKDGQRVIVSSRHQMIDVGDSHVVLQTNRDITAQKEIAELQLRSQKMESLGTLAGGIAHDFNNILLAISGHCGLASQQLAPDDPVQESLGEIERASMRATQLVRRILLFARKQDAKHEIQPLVPIVSEALNLLRASLPAMITIRPRLAAQRLTISADASQIHQIVINMLTNSAHAIGHRAGTIDVSVEVASMDELRTEHPELKEKQYLCLTISDNGCGIATEDLQRIFDPFFTTKAIGEGTGLGLSAVHGIVCSHGGAIQVTSTVGVGTTFKIYFPVAESSSPPDERQTKSDLAGRGEHILYVDDEQMITQLLTKVLNRLSYRVTIFTNPEQALLAFKNNPSQYDLVMTDLSMPYMSGLELAKEVRMIRPDLPIILTSGFLSPEDEAAARCMDIQQVLLKPDLIDQLPACLQRILRSE